MSPPAQTSPRGRRAGRPSTEPASDPSAVRRDARRTLGFERLWPGQEEAILSVLEGHDTLVLLPTGAGKSAIYQLAGARIPGPTLVVSPLIALQRDQIEGVAERGLGCAAALNSTLGEGARREVLARYRAGGLEFLLLSPEQLATAEVLEILSATPPTLFVVDEAHCIADWGHDFRPEYLRLGSVIEALGHPRTLALTATAAPPTRDEIVERLGMRDARVVARGFDRPNIALSVEQFPDEATKRRALLERVESTEGSGIVYVATRRRSVDVAEELAARGVSAQAYHGALGARRRADVQTAFMDDSLRVIVATTAFGMGVDKPTIRFVHHLDVSDTLDAYYQEVGRGGRDREPASAVLFYRPEDLGLRRYQATTASVSEAELARLVRTLRKTVGVVARAVIARGARLSLRKTEAALQSLDAAGFLRHEPTGEVWGYADSALAPPDAAAIAPDVVAGLQRRRLIEQSRVSVMQQYCELSTCRRQYLLNYLGEEAPDRCDNCDNCCSGRTAAALEAPVDDDHGVRVDDAVQHVRWGAGRVIRTEPGRIMVLFESVGYKTLAAEALSEGLLARAG
jgi:ATP-dependent DNA helicase RecQ